MLRTMRRMALSASLLAFLAGSAGGVLAASPNPVVGHVYVNNNSAVHNSVAGFARHLDGTLSVLPGSPFATGGAGTGTPIGSAGAIQFAADGRYVLAVDPASNDISSGPKARVGRPRSASPPTASWSTSPTPALAAAITAASGSSTGTCSPSGARQSACQTRPLLARSCSAATVGRWSQRGSVRAPGRPSLTAFGWASLGA